MVHVLFEFVFKCRLISIRILYRFRFDNGRLKKKNEISFENNVDFVSHVLCLLSFFFHIFEFSISVHRRRCRFEPSAVWMTNILTIWNSWWTGLIFNVLNCSPVFGRTLTELVESIRIYNFNCNSIFAFAFSQDERMNYELDTNSKRKAGSKANSAAKLKRNIRRWNRLQTTKLKIHRASVPSQQTHISTCCGYLFSVDVCFRFLAPVRPVRSFRCIQIRNQRSVRSCSHNRSAGWFAFKFKTLLCFVSLRSTSYVDDDGDDALIRDSIDSGVQPFSTSILTSHSYSLSLLPTPPIPLLDCRFYRKFANLSLSLFASALFSLHPVHVDAVRKPLLSLPASLLRRTSAASSNERAHQPMQTNHVDLDAQFSWPPSCSCFDRRFAPSRSACHTFVLHNFLFDGKYWQTKCRPFFSRQRQMVQYIHIIIWPTDSSLSLSVILPFVFFDQFWTSIHRRL